MIEARPSRGKIPPQTKSLTPLDYGATYRAADLAEWFDVGDETACLIDQLLTQSRRFGSGPRGLRVGQHVLVEGASWLRAYGEVTQASDRRAGGSAVQE